MRTIIDLPGTQIEALDDHCRREGISRAEAVRRAVADHLRRYNRSGAQRAFGLWRGRRLDGLKYQKALRREWGR
jgi:metal-responsive CopG/Arc/MetJ family transcriptional regulator